MDRNQDLFCTAHKYLKTIDDILNTAALSINKDLCDKKVIESYAILNTNIPIVRFALENILEGSGIVITTDFVNGKEIIRYLEDAKYIPKVDKNETSYEKDINKTLNENK